MEEYVPPPHEELFIQITDQIIKLVNAISIDRIKFICEKNNYDTSELIALYNTNFKIKNSKIEPKKRNRKLPPKELQCKGRKNDFTQCTRKKRPGEDYCASHLKNLKYGSVDGDNDDYIEMTEEVIEGNTYLVDSENKVYTNNISSPEWIATKSEDGTLNYIDLDDDTNLKNNICMPCNNEK